MTPERQKPVTEPPWRSMIRNGAAVCEANRQQAAKSKRQAKKDLSKTLLKGPHPSLVRHADAFFVPNRVHKPPEDTCGGQANMMRVVIVNHDGRTTTGAYYLMPTICQQVHRLHP